MCGRPADLLEQLCVCVTCLFACKIMNQEVLGNGLTDNVCACEYVDVCVCLHECLCVDIWCHSRMFE